MRRCLVLSLSFDYPLGLMLRAVLPTRLAVSVSTDAVSLDVVAVYILL